MIATFYDDDEKQFFAEFIAKKINDQINIIAEESAIQPIVNVTTEMIIKAIDIYDGKLHNPVRDEDSYHTKLL